MCLIVVALNNYILREVPHARSDLICRCSFLARILSVIHLSSLVALSFVGALMHTENDASCSRSSLILWHLPDCAF